MPISALLMAFIVLAIVSVFIVRVLDSRITRLRVIASHAKQLLQKIDELKSVTMAISPLLRNNDISLILWNEQIDLLRHIAQLSNISDVARHHSGTRVLKWKSSPKKAKAK